MQILEHGVSRPATEEEEFLLNMPVEISELSYDERVVLQIRQKYSIDDELAILRQRDVKPEEFEQYNKYVEQIKEQERGVVNNA